MNNNWFSSDNAGYVVGLIAIICFAAFIIVLTCLHYDAHNNCINKAKNVQEKCLCEVNAEHQKVICLYPPPAQKKNVENEK